MRYEAISLDELALLPDPEWLIEGVVMRQAVTLVAGPRGSYKTFYAMDMAMTLARDDVWRFPAAITDGHFIDRSTLTDGSGKVLYVVGESRGAAKFRFQAYAEYHGLPGFPEGVRIHPDRVDLYTHPEDVLELVEAEDPDVVIIDTWSRNTYGLGDGIDKKDMDKVLTAVHEMKMGGSRDGRGVVILHHPNLSRSNSLRGHTALGDDTDIIIKMDPPAGLKDGEHKVHVHNERTKEMDEFSSYTAELYSVHLHDPSGKPLMWPSGTPITSLVIGDRKPYSKASATTPSALGGPQKARIWIEERLREAGGPVRLTQAQVAEAAKVSKRDAADALRSFEGYDPETSTVAAADSPDGEDLESYE